MLNNVFNSDAFNLACITNLKEVEQFAVYLSKNLGMIMSPGDDFHDYYECDTDELSFTDEDAETGNRLMRECCEVCKANGVDEYSFLSYYMWKK